MGEERVYQFNYKLATVRVRADNQKRARYNAELAYNYWHTSGKMPTNGAYNNAHIEVKHSDDTE